MTFQCTIDVRGGASDYHGADSALDFAPQSQPPSPPAPPATTVATDHHDTGDQPSHNRKLMFELAGFVLSTVLTIVNAFIVSPTSQELASLEPGDVVLSLRMAFSGGFLFPATFAAVLCFTVAIREACDVAVQRPVTIIAIAPAEEGEVRSVGVRTAMFVDLEAVILATCAALSYVLLALTWFLLVGTPSDTVVILLLWGYIFFRLLPVAVRRWCPKEAAHRLLEFVRRSVLAGIPLSVLPNGAFPYLLEMWSPDNVVFLYPLFLSFVEYLITSVLMNDKVVAGYSDEALSLVGRFTVGLVESSRVGILVVVSNSPAGSFGGLINATILGLVSEALARNNLIAITWRRIRYELRWLWSKFVSSRSKDKPWSAPPRPHLNQMGRFKRVFLGVKVDTEYWGVFVLVLMKCLGWGYGGAAMTAMDPNTGKLVDVLDCSWKVIGVVAIGELAGDLLAGLIGWLMRRYAPSDLHVNVPVITPGDARLVVVMWLNVGGLFLNGISSMGVLSGSLQVTK